MKEYWNEEITDICPNVMFKFGHTNPIDLITLVTDSLDFESADAARKRQFVTQCLQQVIWSKNGVDWYPLIDADGNPRLPEFKDDPTIGFDLYSRFRSKVINPVFTESKTFQNLTKDFTESSKNTTSN